jgi:hypothetical protein
MVSAVIHGIYIDYHLSLHETADYHSVPGFTVHTLIQGDPVAYLEYSCQHWCPLTIIAEMFWIILLEVNKDQVKL